MRCTERFFLFALFLASIVHADAQQALFKGQVLDKATGEPLVFVNVIRGQSQEGTVSDFDGYFSLKAAPGDTIVFSYVGYQEKRLVLREEDLATGEIRSIRMQTTAAELATIVVRPEENPAWRIIRAVLANRRQNDPRRFRGYSYQAYHKTILTVDTFVDNTPKEVNKPEKPPRKAPDPEQERQDSLRAAVFQNDMHFWVTESVTENFFRAPNRKKEYVLAHRSSMPNDIITAGINPIDFQPFGFYREIIRLDFANRDYINPISKSTFDRYDFLLADTIVRGTDTTFIIQYQPYPGKNFAGLKGLLYVNTAGYALENVIAQPADTMQTIGFDIQQQSRRIDGQWFPARLQTDLFIRMGMGEVYMEYAFRNRSELSAVSMTIPPNGIFNHYYRENESTSGVINWDSVRTVPLDRRERNTYVWWDSLPELRSSYRFLKVYNGAVHNIATGLWGMGPLDIVLPDLLRLNQYENVRLGLGLRTGPSLTRWGHIYGYAGYGIRDKAWKYGGAVEVKVYPHRDFRLRASYSNDLVEPGMTTYLSAVNNPWSGLNARSATRVLMDSREEIRLDAFYRPASSWLLNPFALREERQPNYEYSFVHGEETRQSFQRESVGLRLRWAPREQLIKMGRLETLLRPAFPIVEVLAEQSRLTEMDRIYTRLETQLSHELRTKSLGTTRVRLQGGWLSETVPYPFLFNAPGTRTDDNNGIFTAYAFQTMGLNEFAADQYIALFFEHSFGRLLGRPPTPYCQPELTLLQNLGWGSQQNAAQHERLDFRDYRAGYWESGVRVDNILRIPYFKAVYLGLGGGVFYRWGAYQLPVMKDNFRWQLSLTISV